MVGPNNNWIKSNDIQTDMLPKGMGMQNNLTEHSTTSCLSLVRFCVLKWGTKASILHDLLCTCQTSHCQEKQNNIVCVF